MKIHETFLKFKIVLFIFILIILINPTDVKSDWGNGDCSTYHGITYHSARYIKSPIITLDGVETKEESWNRADVLNYIIPMANHIDSQMRFTSYMHIKYIYDDTNLYIKARWNDSTPIDRQDQLYFCWNINCTNFTVSMYLEDNAMRTNETGARVDCWKWMHLTRINGSTKEMADECFDSDNWLSEAEDNNPTATFTAGTSIDEGGYYQLEIIRPLTTKEPDVDVQFELNKSFRFSTGVGDSIGSNEHAISWTYELDLSNSTYSNCSIVNTIDSTNNESNSNNINGYNIGFFLTSIIFPIVALSQKLLKRNIKNKIKNKKTD